ncbi:MAG: FAD-dependent protein [Saprospiraceae bacterium]
MSNSVDFKIHPSDLNNLSAQRNAIIEQSPIELPEHFNFKITRRNIDARNKQVWYVLRAEIIEFSEEKKITSILSEFKNVSHSKPVHIIGAGPCGYFAALQLIKLGLKPIILDRGKDVQERRRDLRAIQQEGIVNPNSNYCFGEGGAGTYSDGKLYTRSDKRGNIKYILQLLVEHGASEDIMIDVHPHIGSNKLPELVKKMRETILQYGGEIHFNQCLEDILIKDQKIKSIRCTHAEFDVDKLILCTGHSARDIYELLQRKQIEIHCKPFALGVRIEHPQSLIDEIQYKQSIRNENLPAASYSLSCQLDDVGVFSFCMCPGGLIVPAATSPGEIVVNGMSLSRRDSPFANSGMVTEVNEKDFIHHSKKGALQGMYFQKEIENKVFNSSDGTQRAPAQKLMDFLHNKISTTLPESSYIPGLLSASMDELLPKNIAMRIKNGLLEFGKRMPAYLSNEAVLLATESRTSAPVRIPRHVETCEHTHLNGLYPAGEGAGYAGGILSAALDGIRVADAIAKNI